MEKRRLIIMMRMPKTGSTTLAGVAQRIYKDRTFHGNPNKVLLMPMAERRKIDVVSGHLRYGIHEELWKPYIYTTMLREPVDRVVSGYYHLLDNKNHRLHKTATSMSFLEFITRHGGETYVTNIQTKFLCGFFHVRNPTGVVPLPGHIPPPGRQLEIAIENLDREFIYGIAERFEDSLTLFATLLGWREIPKWKNRRVRAKRPRVIELPDPIYNAIRERNILDIKLYRHAAFEFEKKMRKLGL